MALIHWFEKKRARALSAMQLGMARGRPVRAAGRLGARQPSAGAPPRFASGLIIIGRLPAAVVRVPPPARGHRRRPWTASPPVARMKSRRHQDERARTRDFTAREALRTRAFWLLSLGHGFALLVVQAVNTHAITHMKEGLGYTLEQAAFAITLQTVAQLGGVGLGALDRRPLRQALARRRSACWATWRGCCSSPTPPARR